MSRRRLSILLAVLALFTVASCDWDDDDPAPAGTQPPPPPAPPALMGGSVQTSPLSLTGVTTYFAGAEGTFGSTDDNGTLARFSHPKGITTDGTNLYVVDQGNQTIRRIVIATGEVTTIAGGVGLAGSADGTGSDARFDGPTGITTDGTNLYVTDYNNHTIRRITPAGVVSTLAGAAGVAGSTNSTGTAARFNLPHGITTDNTNLYVTEQGNHTIRKIVIATGEVTTLAGTAGATGSVDETGAAARFTTPAGITTDGRNLYVAALGNHTIRKVDIATGAVTTLAGTAGATGSTDDTGSAARFNAPRGITCDGTNLYVAEAWNHTLRKVVIATGAVTTVAGTALSSGSADGTGAAARFDNPDGLTTDGTSLFMGDNNNNAVRRIR